MCASQLKSLDKVISSSLKVVTRSITPTAAIRWMKRRFLAEFENHRRNLRGYAYLPLIGEGVPYPPLLGRMTEINNSEWHYPGSYF